MDRRKKGLILFGIADLILIALIAGAIMKVLPTTHIETEISGQEGAAESYSDTVISSVSSSIGSGVEEIAAPTSEGEGPDQMTGRYGSEADEAGSAAEESVFAGAEAAGLAHIEMTSQKLEPYDLKPTRRCLVDSSFWAGCPPRDIQLLTPNPNSRPQYALEEVHDIVIHYVANPGTSAQQNRDYFESLKDSDYKASSHFVVGLDGEIIQCISCSEWSYASNSRNHDTISIECCHPDWSGKFTDATYESVVDLTAWLCGAFGIGPERVIRHYDVTGKDCPRYFVQNPDEWEKFLADVKTAYEAYYG